MKGVAIVEKGVAGRDKKEVAGHGKEGVARGAENGVARSAGGGNADFNTKPALYLCLRKLREPAMRSFRFFRAF